jgi:hypothetical protein
MRSRICFSWLVLLAAAGSAHAAVILTTGPVDVITPPAFVSPGVDYAASPDRATVWSEQLGVSLTNLPVDIVNNPGSSSSATPGLVSGTVDSYFFHFRHTSGQPIHGTLTFAGNIVGVAFLTPALNGSDPFVAPVGTTYDTSMTRGIFSLTESLSISGNVLTFDVVGDPSMLDTTQFRVFAHEPGIPAPGPAALLSLGGLIACRRRRA